MTDSSDSATTDAAAGHYRQLDDYYALAVYKRQPITLTQGRGARVWDVEGNEYIDALAGISNLYHSPQQAELAADLVERSGLDRAFFCNSGGEANEAAIKLARRFGHAHSRGGHIITFTGCFHGRTLGTIAGGKEAYRKGFEPGMPGFTQVPFNDFKAFRDAITPETCAVMLEPIQGEGGLTPANDDFLRAVCALCREQGILIILDEIQCGMGRTGKFFAHEHYSIQPDIMTLAKALGGGLPIGATLCTQEVADALPTGTHGTTFGGNPLCCAASLAVLKAIDEEGLLEQATEKGDWLMERLQSAGVEGIREVRGKGLMIGLELDFSGDGVVDDLREQGILGNVTAGNVIRLVPPIVITQEDLQRVAEAVLDTISRLRANAQPAS